MTMAPNSSNTPSWRPRATAPRRSSLGSFYHESALDENKIADVLLHVETRVT